jgi:hypothetical protein
MPEALQQTLTVVVPADLLHGFAAVGLAQDADDLFSRVSFEFHEVQFLLNLSPPADQPQGARSAPRTRLDT